MRNLRKYEAYLALCSDAFFEKVEKGKIMKLLDNISDMISNFEYDYYTRNMKMRLGGKC